MLRPGRPTRESGFCLHSPPRRRRCRAPRPCLVKAKPPADLRATVLTTTAMENKRKNMSDENIADFVKAVVSAATCVTEDTAGGHAVAQVAVELTVLTKSAMFSSLVFLRLFSMAVTVRRAVRSSATGLSLISAFILHGECCGGSVCGTGRDIELSNLMIAACILCTCTITAVI